MASKTLKRLFFYLFFAMKIGDNDVEIARRFSSLKGSALKDLERGSFIAEGEKIAAKAIEKGIKIISVLAEEKRFESFRDVLGKAGVSEEKIYVASKKIVEKIVGYKFHRGIIALCELPSYSDIDRLGDRIAILNGLANAENVGSIARNASAFGFDAIIFDKRTAHPYLRRAVRVSMGAIFDLKIFESADLKKDAEILKAKGYEIIAAELTEDASPIDDLSAPEKVAVVFGSEGEGISSDILELSDKIVYVPIENVPSLNVAASSAVIFREIAKRSGLKPSGRKN